MKLIQLNSAGKGWLDVDEPDGNNVRKAKCFLQQLLEMSVDYSNRFVQVTSEFPLEYREKQSTAMIAYALSKISDTFQTELPIKKKRKGKKDGNSWVDFWAHYRNADFFIELKQSYYRLQSNLVNSELWVEWQRVSEQIKSIENKETLLYTVSNSAVLIPLMIVPIFWKVKPNEQLDGSNHDFNLVYNQIKEELQPKPTWGYIWEVQEDIVDSTAYIQDDGSIVLIPAVIFLANISTIS